MGKVIEKNGIQYKLISNDLVEVTKEGEKLGDDISRVNQVI